MSVDVSWLDNLTLAELETDADQIFSRLRKEAPIAWIPALNAWIATTWSHCREIAEDAEHFRGGTSPAHDRVFGQPNVLSAEGQTHGELRRVIDPPLRPRAFKSTLDTTVRAAVRARLDELAGRTHVDLLADYFEPVSVRCVADRFGFTHISTDRLQRWFHSLSHAAARGLVDPEAYKGGDAAAAEIREVVADMVERLRSQPDESAISHWLHDGMPGGEVRGIEHMLPSLLIILLGGLQEPGHACGSTFLGLTTRPEQLGRVVENPALLPKAVAEGLRWLSPLFSGASRVPNRDIELSGVRLRQGDTVWLCYGSANHDEAEFGRPEIYDLDRPAHGHLAFGTGRHACSGSAFAPQIARIALEELLARHPRIRLEPDHEIIVRGWMFRGATQLPVRMSR
ncbi:cytochrome P450 [Streptomyces iranensis]|uniref:cytochrome P450 n=1 Tax=Streptomyces iranensis TaxID=576784 RepID=UPI0039B77E1D